ncbi:phage terminase small subunit P27 family [Palleronia sp. LCG004]|uniref:phage terminase small subunit P27 family n=1 Tax=Palleronia sp. LCG004 TaxID=3079304 RepID=UPI002943AACD|nr:phage terminase small subunit P27 family [Palleronia sp. LCG004]WOI55125.1 phage terminase small subunit P27 family [Palleronia sp. LCG004]
MKGTKPHLQTDPAAIGELAAPDWLSSDARAEWCRVMPILSERRILTDADLGGLENYCIAIGTVREMERYLQAHGHVIGVDGAMKRNPAVGIQSDAMTRARLLAAEMGLTPVSRSRPAIRDEEDDDDLAELD